MYSSIFNNDTKSQRSKKEQYIKQATDEELNTLESTFRELGVNSVISLNLDELNNKIDNFSIEKKDFFTQELQGEFRESVNRFLLQLNDLDGKLDALLRTNQNDMKNINTLSSVIQKIEEKNHRCELKNNNRIKLKDYMKNLLDQLTISPSRKEVLLTTQYIAMSELVIVSEVLDNFVNFYKTRKKQDIQMDIVKEGEELIKSIITRLIQNFNANVYDYIKKASFSESNLFRMLPSFKNDQLKKTFDNVNFTKLNQNRISLKNYLLDRKFVIRKINTLFNNQEDLNQIDAFSLCRNSFAKGLRDAFASEFNKMVGYWEIFFNSKIFNDNNFTIDLESNTFLSYDPFKSNYTEPIYEASKFFSCVILNAFFNCDLYIDYILMVFNESPMFNIEKDTNEYSDIEKIVTAKVYDSMSKNFDFSREKSIIFAILIYSILSAVQEKLKKAVRGDFVQLNIKDIFEIRKNEEDLSSTLHDNDIIMMNDDNAYELEEIGVYKISCGETKTFIAENMKTLKSHIMQFLNKQKEIIANYTCKIHRVGIIPIVRKTINFLKLVLLITNGIKNEFTYELFNEFKVKLKLQIEKIASTDKKYTNIVLAENFHYIVRFLRSFSSNGVNIDDPKFVDIEEEFFDLFIKHSNYYAIEVFDYQFKEFGEYYHSFISEYNVNKKQIKIQNNFTLQIFEKKVNTFLKGITKEIEPMAKRIIKHYTKEEGLSPFMWNEEVKYFNKVLINIQNFYKECYNKTVDLKEYINKVSSYNFKEIYNKKN